MLGVPPACGEFEFDAPALPGAERREALVRDGHLRSGLHKMRRLGLREGLRRAIHRFVLRPGFRLLEPLGLHVLPVHYYSPVPDTRDLRRRVREWYRPWSFAGIDMRLGNQIRLVEQLGRKAAPERGREPLPRHDDVARRGLGEGYEEIDAHILHSMIRLLRPEKVVEIGAGVSSYFAADALSANRKGRLISVEPHPIRGLDELIRSHELELITEPVQNLGLDFFQQLNERDILFIDSSHVVRLGGDVPYLILEVLPGLAPGVVIHIHDIPFPFPTPPPDKAVFRQHRFWTESMLVYAFLQFNKAFEVLLSPSYLESVRPGLLGRVFPLYDRRHHTPSSLWLKKVT